MNFWKCSVSSQIYADEIQSSVHSSYFIKKNHLGCKGNGYAIKPVFLLQIVEHSLKLSLLFSLHWDEDLSGALRLAERRALIQTLAVVLDQQMLIIPTTETTPPPLHFQFTTSHPLLKISINICCLKLLITEKYISAIGWWAVSWSKNNPIVLIPQKLQNKSIYM